MANLRPLRLRLLVFLGFGLAVAAVVTAGYWNFSNVQKLVEAQTESASTGRYQYLLQDVVRVVINTDNSLRQYTLDRSRKSLKAYQHAADTLETRIVKLASFPRQDDRLDSVMLWMEEKNCIMQEVAEEVKKAKNQDREALRDMFSAIRKVPNRQFTQPSIPQADPEEEGESVDLESKTEQAYIEPFENEVEMLKVGELETLIQSLKPFEDEVVLAQNKAEKAEVRAVRAERLFKENPKQFRKKRADKLRKEANGYWAELRKKETLYENLSKSAYNQVAGESEDSSIKDSTSTVSSDPSSQNKTARNTAQKARQAKQSSDKNNRQYYLGLIQAAREMSKKERKLLAEQVEIMNVLLRRDRELMGKLLGVLDQMQEEQRTSSEENMQLANEYGQNAQDVISLLSPAILALLLLLLVVIFRDLSKNARLQKSLLKETERAQKLAKAKEDFLSTMSHELRTPMNAITGFARQLQDTMLNSQQRTFTQTINRAADHLLALLNDVLDFSKIESGNLQLESIPFRPSEIFEDVQSTYSDLALRKNIEFEVSLEKDTPEVLQGDPLRLRQILFNLTSNAIKFTKKGHVHISAKMKKGKKGRDILMVTIEDTGIGIPKEKQKHIFQAFRQADSGTTRKFGGTGLGLAISKRLLEAHNGKISVSSKEGKGTTFSLEIPYASSQLSALDFKTKSVDSQSFNGLAGKRILVADDDAYNRLLIETILEKWSVETHFVTDGQQLLDVLKSDSNFDFLLVDLQMPKLGGLEAMEILRKKMDMQIPCVGLTASAGPEVENACLDAGMQAYLLKPFDEAHLYQMLVELLGGKAVPEATVRKEDEMSNFIEDEKPSKAPSIKPAQEIVYKGWVLSAKMKNNNPDFLKKMLRLFVDIVPEHTGAMQLAAELESWPQLAFAAHKLAPKVRHVGGGYLADTLKQIEIDAQSPQPPHDLSARALQTAKALMLMVEDVQKVL